MVNDITHGKDGHMDTGVQAGLIIAEDDILKGGEQYPEYTATMFIMIENYYNGIAKGYLQTFYYEETFYFLGLIICRFRLRGNGQGGLKNGAVPYLSSM